MTFRYLFALSLAVMLLTLGLILFTFSIDEPNQIRQAGTLMMGWIMVVTGLILASIARELRPFSWFEGR